MAEGDGRSQPNRLQLIRVCCRGRVVLFRARVEGIKKVGYREPGKSANQGEFGLEAPPIDQACRRAYYRVPGFLPVRLARIAPEDVGAAIFDLSIPDPLLQPISEVGEETPLMERLRRIEDKLDLLLGVSSIDVPTRLSGRDRQPIVFSGSGLALDVTWSFASGDFYTVEILLPPPYSRTLRAVAEAVSDSAADLKGDALRNLPLSLTHMEDEERDALVGYSYDLQRFALRTRLGDEETS